MRTFKSHPLLKLVNSYVIDSPQPSNLSYLWNFGSLLAFCLIIQIVTGVTLAMHYNPSVLEAFNSVEHIMRDVNNGWLIRYLHSNTASAFFFLVYLHIGRNLYYSSYKAPRTLSFALGVVILVVMMATAFLGYVLPYGQMSLWGATVITNLMSAIPWIGQDIVEFIWGGFSVGNATLNRFFALHFVLPFVIAALVLMHLIALHDTVGSSNPLGLSGNYDRLAFAPYFIFKDLVTIFLFILVLSIFVFFMPNVLGDSENYVMANPMQTPPAIVPEWYLLPFYAILRSIPNKLLGVIAMFAALVILLTLPFTDVSRTKGAQFKPLSKIIYYIFVANFLMLMVLGAKHVESPFIELGQISTVIYFSYFLLLVPQVTLFENTLTEMPAVKKKSFLTDNASTSLNDNAFTPLTANILGIFNLSIPKPHDFAKEPLESVIPSLAHCVPAMVQRLRASSIPNPYNDYWIDKAFNPDGTMKTDRLGRYRGIQGELIHPKGLIVSEKGVIVRDLKGNWYENGVIARDRDHFHVIEESTAHDIKWDVYHNACNNRGYRITMYDVFLEVFDPNDRENCIGRKKIGTVRGLTDPSTGITYNNEGKLIVEYDGGPLLPRSHPSPVHEFKRFDHQGIRINEDGVRLHEDGRLLDGVGVKYHDGYWWDATGHSLPDLNGNRLNPDFLLVDKFGCVIQNGSHSYYSFTDSKWQQLMIKVSNDSPRPWGLYFQDSASPQMEGLIELHDNIMFYLVIILFSVGWILISVVRNYSYKSSPISHKYSNHGTLIELIWTITPALILILIAFPSFKLLYLMDEVSDPAMAVLAEGHQWYWSYQYPDFLSSGEELVEFDSYLVPEPDLEEGALRMLEVDNRVILPELTHVRFIVTAADVIHSYACPALGIKCDAYPGRLSQVSVLANRVGVFYGQCSEICGILHSSMPIVVESLPIEKFLTWLEDQ